MQGVAALVAVSTESWSYCPTAHARQPELPEAPAIEKVPFPHDVHGVAGLLSASLVPAAHCVHDVEPATIITPILMEYAPSE